MKNILLSLINKKNLSKMKNNEKLFLIINEKASRMTMGPGKGDDEGLVCFPNFRKI